ncbi:MAG TPA: hypothetical protein VEZ40_03540 [Pyrinomonadaceae bacterium]|nr:hypothetical protein [Pyrinomonadaceae bacterium]
MKLSKTYARMLLAALVAAGLSGAARAQRVITVPGSREEYEAYKAEREAQMMRRQMERENERFKRESELRRTRRASSAVPLPPARKMTAEHKRRLYPTEAERASLAALLREDGTGLARLLPYTGCVVDPRIVNVAGSCVDQIPPVAGGGSFYSFRAGKHHPAFQADLALRNNLFNAGFMPHTLGLLTTLGDVPLDAVTLHSQALRPFLKLVPAATLAETEQEFKRSRPWLEAPDHAYGPTAPVRANTTYVLRAIAFEPNRSKPSDVLVAFRVTRKDADGAVTFAWKQLQKPKN